MSAAQALHTEPAQQQTPNRSSHQPALQAKLVDGAAAEQYEQEEGAVTQMMAMPGAAPALQLMAQPAAPALQLMPEPEEPMQMMAKDEKPVQGLFTGIQRQEGSSPAMNSGGTSHSLPGGLQGKAESVLGHNLSNVQLKENKSANNINALAYTQGNTVTFAPGQYSPGTRSGQQLIGHELTHVAQQREGRVQPTVQKKGVWINDQDHLEQEADDKGWDIVNAPPVSTSAASAPPPPAATTVQRQVIQGSIIDDILDYIDLDDIIDSIPGYNLFSYIIGYDFLRRRSVEPSATNLVKGLLTLLGPLGLILFNKLVEYGILENIFTFVKGQLSDLNLSTDRLWDTIDDAYDDMDFVRTDPIAYNLRVLERHFGQLYDDVVTFISNIADAILDFLTEALVRPLVGYLEENSPAYVLATKVFGRKIPLEDPVEATTEEIIVDFLVLIGKETEVQQMQERGVIGELAEWIDTQLFRFDELTARFFTIVEEAWNAFSLNSISDIPGVFMGIYNQFTTLLADFGSFALDVAMEVLELVKKALLGWLATFANDIPGFHLLTVIIRRNPFTGEKVPRSVQNIIRGFMSLVPGGEAKYQEMVETGVIPNAAERINALVAQLGINWEMIVGIFTGIWETFTIENFLNPVETFQQIVNQFAEPVSRLFRFVVGVVKIVVELVLQLMNFPSDLIISIMANASQAFNDIKRDPIGFLMNVLGAVKQGFSQFFENILDHLLSGLTGWLFGQMENAGITPPADFSFQSILNLVLQILGISTEQIMGKIAERIGPERFARIQSFIETASGVFGLVKDVIERGPIALWERIQAQLSNLWDTVLENIRNWVMTQVVEKVTTKLLTMLDPTGIMALINGAIAFFNAIQSFIEYFREMLEMVNTFTQGVADIAKGSLATAANFLEGAMSQGMPVAIGFLANQAGLGGLGHRIGEMIAGLQERVDRAIDGVLDWIAEQMQRLMDRMRPSGSDSNQGTTDSERDDSQVVEPFRMSGKSHTLTIQTTDRGLTVEMASPNPGALQGKINDEIEKQGDVARTFAAKGDNNLAAYHIAAARALQNILTWYDREKNDVNQFYTDPEVTESQIREELQELAEALTNRIVQVSVQYRLEDFARDTFNLQENLNSIENQVVDQIEKHADNPNATGDGMAYTAAAAEMYLGWIASSNQRHITKVSTAIRVINNALVNLAPLEENGIPINNERWVVRGRSILRQCNDAISNPRGFLQGRPRSVMFEFLNDMDARGITGNAGAVAYEKRRLGIL
ncbi:MAG: DUF4157 domain-containing protein [Cyclobacteriaceae bacterium]